MATTTLEQALQAKTATPAPVSQANRIPVPVLSVRLHSVTRTLQTNGLVGRGYAATGIASVDVESTPSRGTLAMSLFLGTDGDLVDTEGVPLMAGNTYRVTGAALVRRLNPDGTGRTLPAREGLPTVAEYRLVPVDDGLDATRTPLAFERFGLRVQSEPVNSAALAEHLAGGYADAGE